MLSTAKVAPSTKNATWLTPLSSVASAATLMVPDTVAPSAGLVTATAGGSSTLSTVTDTWVASVVAPTSSVVRAFRVWLPSGIAVVSQS